MTESLGSRSDHSGQSVVLAGSRTRMDVVCVLDINQNERLQHRKRAFEEVKNACHTSNANCIHIQVSLYKE